MNNPTDELGWVVVYFDVSKNKAVAQNFATSEESYELQVAHPESSLYRGKVYDVPLGCGDDKTGTAV